MKEFSCIIEVTDKEVIKEIKESLKKPISDKAIKRNKKARELLNKARRG
ncbi:hypothetical protein ACSXDM_15700 (plasmid) [Clostridium perfringens]